MRPEDTRFSLVQSAKEINTTDISAQSTFDQFFIFYFCKKMFSLQPFL